MSDDNFDRFARHFSARIVRTPFGRVRYLWRCRFGREWSKTECLDYFTEEHGLERDEAEELTFEEVANFLRLDPEQLDETDKMILEVIPKEGGLTADGISKQLGYSPTHDVVRQRLKPRDPLRSEGFVGWEKGRHYFRIV